MTPEEKQMLKEVFEWMENMQSSSTIPKTTDDAIRGRFLSSSSVINESNKSASSENQSVNESGSASYSVLKAPDGFDERSDNGIIKYYPYFT